MPLFNKRSDRAQRGAASSSRRLGLVWRAWVAGLESEFFLFRYHAGQKRQQKRQERRERLRAWWAKTRSARIAGKAKRESASLVGRYHKKLEAEERHRQDLAAAQRRREARRAAHERRMEALHRWYIKFHFRATAILGKLQCASLVRCWRGELKAQKRRREREEARSLRREARRAWYVRSRFRATSILSRAQCASLVGKWHRAVRAEKRRRARQEAFDRWLLAKRAAHERRMEALHRWYVKFHFRATAILGKLQCASLVGHHHLALEAKRQQRRFGEALALRLEELRVWYGKFRFRVVAAVSAVQCALLVHGYHTKLRVNAWLQAKKEAFHRWLQAQKEAYAAWLEVQRARYRRFQFRTTVAVSAVECQALVRGYHTKLRVNAWLEEKKAQFDRWLQAKRKDFAAWLEVQRARYEKLVFRAIFAVAAAQCKVLLFCYHSLLRLRQWIKDSLLWLLRTDAAARSAVVCGRYQTGLQWDTVMNTVLDRVCALPAVAALGEWLYGVGFQTEYTFIRAGRFSKVAGSAVLQFVRRLPRWVLLPILRVIVTFVVDLLHPFYRVVHGAYAIGRHMRTVRKERGILASLWEGLCYLGRGIKRYAVLIPRALCYVIPACAAVMFVTVVYNTMTRAYTLAVQVNGQTVGYVASEQVFDNAKSNVDERISYAGTHATEWKVEPSYTLSTELDVMSESEMADAILRASSAEIQEGTALYIDGALYAITADGDYLRLYLSDLIEPYRDPYDTTQRLRFNREMTLVDGVFFTDSFTDYADICERLEGVEQAEVTYTVVAGDSLSLIASKNDLTLNELLSYNNGLTLTSKIFPGDTLIVGQERKFLQIWITRTATRREDIPFTTQEQTSTEMAWGTSRVVTEGRKGRKEITEDITCDADGNVLSVVQLSETVLEEPVNKVVVKGTRLPTGAVGQYGGTNFMWPVPNYTYCSRWFGTNGHKGVDICAPQGTAILASESGVVVKAGYNKAGAGTNYGYSIIIDHGNGYSTVYAHCVALYVSPGQSVKRGDLIAAVGSTGRSSGNHCHFEIRYGGSKLPPQNWFGSSRRPV